MLALTLTLTAMLAGCAAERPGQDDLALRRFVLDAGGVALTDRPLRIDFGRTRSSTVPAMAKLMAGPPEAAVTRDNCGDGAVEIVRWRQGLSLIFRDGDFRGWVAEGGNFATSEGWSPGMTRAEMGSEVGSETGTEPVRGPRGWEVQRRGIHAVIENPGASARVVAIWAGNFCQGR